VEAVDAWRSDAPPGFPPMSSERDREKAIRRTWFDQGCQAFTRAFPHIAATLPTPNFYVCPLCLHAFGEDALEGRFLTREDVPPRSVGGRKIVLTCRRCNSGSGHDLDNHVRLEADLHAFATMTLEEEIHATLRAGSARMPIHLSAGGSFKMFGVPKAAAPGQREELEDYLRQVGAPGGPEVELHITFRPFSSARARVGWLRAAYLAFFAALGYRFIMRPELDVVRERIKKPEEAEPEPFRVVSREKRRPALIIVKSPEDFQGYVMFHGHNTIFLPRWGDHKLYQRLAAHPSVEVNFTGKEMSWPNRPVLALDFIE
jgi:hypothetical protein